MEETQPGRKKTEFIFWPFPIRQTTLPPFFFIASAAFKLKGHS
jgi:hypothetical protein